MVGNLAVIPAEETEITQSFRPEEPLAPEPTGPPPGLVNDVWPWLALLGVLAVAGLLVWLFVFRGDNGHKQAKTPPRVVGMQEQPAIKQLTGAGYSVKSIHQPLNKPQGIVGSQAANGSTVVIHVSNGKPVPKAVTTTAQTTTRQTTTVAAPASAVPDVTGQTADAGAGQVEAAGFVAETDPVEGGGTAGSITQQSPPGGTQGKAGETVTLGVATGSSRPAVQIPDVVGKAAADARAALLQAKLTVRTTYKQGKTGVVLGESPTGSAPAWTQVTISVGR